MEEMMTTLWKLKSNSFDVLLVHITLMLVKAEWTAAESHQVTDAFDGSAHQTHIYVGNDEIAHYFFGSSIANNSFILEDVRNCLDSFQLFTCLKMLLLTRINDVASLMEDSSVGQRDLQLLNGLLTFKVKNATANSVPEKTNHDLSLDEEIAEKVRRIFSRRSLSVNLLPKIKIEIEPSRNSKDSFLCFRYAVHRDEGQSAKGDAIEGRKRKKSSGGMPMMMIVPPLIMLGLMPFTLASLKAMVMNAVMINMMALNGAIFMTIRNLVFGPRRGDNVKYVNYGYSKDRQTQSRRPVLIIHSPAAFVKQPSVQRNPRPAASPPIQNQQHFSDGGSPHSHSHHHHHHHHHHSADHVGDYEDRYYFIRESDHNNRYENGGKGTEERPPDVRRRTNIRGGRN